ncbi:MAG: hypothetical protein ACRD0U_15450, partial [Acidimicrobiales bacterium]
VEPTAAGRRVMERGRARRLAVMADILGGLSRRELQAVDTATGALAAALQPGSVRDRGRSVCSQPSCGRRTARG